MGYRNTILALFAFAAGTVVLGGCDPKRDEHPCTMMDNPSTLVTTAEVVRVDVYNNPNVHCDGSNVPLGAGSPDISRSFGKGERVAVDVAPGHHTFVLTTFSDAAGEVPLGEGCQEVDVTPGSRLCFMPALQAVAACRSNADCAGTVNAPDCDTSTHRCVQCLTNDECGGGSCCNHQCTNTASDKNNCGTCGKVCPGDDAGACCSGTCANLEAVESCGMCGAACSTNHITAACSAGNCAGTCASGYHDCNKDLRSDGCECAGFGCCPNGTCQYAHNNGFGGVFYDCYPPLPTTPDEQRQKLAIDAAISVYPTGSPQYKQWNGVSDYQDTICMTLSNNGCACWTYAGSGSPGASYVGMVAVLGPGQGCSAVSKNPDGTNITDNRTWN